MTDRLTVAVASSKGTVDFFDVASGEKLGRVDGLTAEPHELTWDRGRRRAYLSHTYRSGFYNGAGEKGHEISAIDVDAMVLLSVYDVAPYISPHGVEYNRHDDLIYAGVEESSPGRNGLVVVAPDGRVVGNIPTRATNTHWLAFATDGRTAYTSHKEYPNLSVLDLSTRKQIDEIPLPGGAEEDVSRDGRWLFAVTPSLPAQRGAHEPARTRNDVPRLVKIDLASGNVVGEAELGAGISAIRATGDGRVLVGQLPLGSPDAGTDGFLHVVDTESMVVKASLALERGPFTSRITDDDTTAFVANTIAGTVSVVDLGTYCVTRTLSSTPDPSWGGTHGIVVFAGA